MTVESNKLGQVLVLSPVGRLDAETAPGLQDQIVGHIADGETTMLLDLSDLTYVSSAGLRAILIAAKKLQELDGRFALCGLSDPVAEVFSVSGFDAILTIHVDQPTALTALS